MAATQLRTVFVLDRVVCIHFAALIAARARLPAAHYPLLTSRFSLSRMNF